MTRLLFILFTLPCIVSCNSSGYSASAGFEVTNQTKEVIDSILVQPDRQRYNYFSLEPGKTTKVVVKLGGLPDGAYGITYKIRGQYRNQAFGYFSNGVALEPVHKIFIQPDTVIYKTN